ncbi:tRNA (adenine-N(1)-)-methyltransferase catalytic subunit trm61 [Gnomoniopsis smithogilvyi]|uniref:tRNA (adenine(58)-N(1))-methyltransferase catalytic subunit TRM61 n=1 Tax=Gnomoniopsis smithogilvyi TaxID=1191159 RepID=A0A9W8YMQ7_9PEZI|nr:tRNA (adenine-N(1)-)-methyltransferase catalytic subunit trm61 [Gnomoniopsis smithogilvyi]
MDCSFDSSTGQLTSIPTIDNGLPEQSPFLQPGKVTRANTLAIIQLSKDDFIPVYLRDTQGEHDGYKEGHVINTRFGSFPHSTLIGIPWGSQVRASVVDTGSRGRKKKNLSAAAAAKNNGKTEEQEEDTSGALKRKRDANDEGEKRVKSAADEAAATAAQSNTATEQQAAAAPIKEAPMGDAEQQDANEKPTEPPASGAKKQLKNNNMSAAQSGFVHILPPTPEIWTTSLPHRTQVVYTPDYSYILQRIRARPGTRLIEAGSGSGSFTHASARAVYNGAPKPDAHATPTGKVFSFEYHEQRFEKMRREIQEHGLSSVVEVNHRDVYNEGFLVDGQSPQADAVFLDLPAPWLALPHLSRQKPKTGAEMDGVEGATKGDDGWVSPLNPKKSVYICTFSPCIEQVTRTISAMRKLGWVEIDMVEISHKRIQVLREKVGLDVVSDRGVQMAPKDVKEALVKLREVEVKSAEHHAKMVGQHSKPKMQDDDDDVDDEAPQAAASKVNGGVNSTSLVADEANKQPAVKSFMQGQLITKPETELKAHTSYLVFAVLPREWTEEDEAAAAAKWPIGNEPRLVVAMDRESRKQQKREMLLSKRKKNKKEVKDGSGKADEAKTKNDKVEDVKMEKA